MEIPAQIQCPKCGSTQITANKKGFSGKKAVAGAVLTGGIGLLAGTIGSNKVIITCLNCGKEFKPGEKRATTFSQSSDKQVPRLIWDEQEKKHVINPAYGGSGRQLSPAVLADRRAKNKIIGRVFGVIFALLGIAIWASGMIFLGVVFLLLSGFFLLMGFAIK
jgi:predicted RNA-binding Zn-ribbon protein involved in translation (DUF1610 family)